MAPTPVRGAPVCAPGHRIAAVDGATGKRDAPSGSATARSGAGPRERLTLSGCGAAAALTDTESGERAWATGVRAAGLRAERRPDCGPSGASGVVQGASDRMVEEVGHT